MDHGISGFLPGTGRGTFKREEAFWSSDGLNKLFNSPHKKEEVWHFQPASMLSSVFSLLLSCVVAALLSSSGWCYQMYRPFDEQQQQQMFRRGSNDASFPKVIAADIFGSEDSSDRENDSSLSADELSVLSSVLPASSSVSKRRKGPTLSVVNPLEVLRQNLMLDLARQRIRQNQKQIAANGELLEKIGKRQSRQQHPEEELRAMMVEGGNNFQP